MVKLLFLLSFTLLFKENVCIFGGYKSFVGAIPYQVGIFKNGDYVCGGALIDRKIVLTAASCLEKAQHVKVLVGSTNARVFEAYSKLLDARCWTAHHDYRAGVHNYNIAVVILEKPIRPRYNVLPIDLAQKDPMEGETVTLSGFGKTRALFSESSSLHHAPLKILSHESCKSTYMFLFTEIQLSELCTEGAWPNGKGACVGDEGSPLISVRENPELVGIVNVPTFACDGVLPTIYTSVVQFRDWIQENKRCHFDDVTTPVVDKLPAGVDNGNGWDY